jgi:hypothetical protein
MDILIKLATRERPQRAIDTVKAFAEMADYKVRFLVSIDNDDSTTRPLFLDDFNYVHGGIKVVSGISRNKIHACNRDLEDEQFDILILAADDMRPKVRGYDNIIRLDMMKHWPNLDGVLHYWDGHAGDKMFNTLPIMGWNYYKKFGYIYNPEYNSLFADNEFTAVAKRLNRFVGSEQCIIEHCHPLFRNKASVKLEPDALLKRTEGLHATDKGIYEWRKKNNFDLSPMLLSVLICSLESRSSVRLRLLESLNRQINNHPARQQIEILLDIDNGEKIVGQKRNDLLDRALGTFSVFIDDDDMISDDYIAKIVEAIQDHPDADCVRLEGEYYEQGKPGHNFITSLEYSRWRTAPDGTRERTPNHISPVRTEHARSVRFPVQDFGEDSIFSSALLNSGRLKKEAPTSGVLYHYMYDRNTSTSVHTRRKNRVQPE